MTCIRLWRPDSFLVMFAFSFAGSDTMLTINV
jgi:hypothetical protein